MIFRRLQKLQPGDKVAILSPSFAAPGMFPKVFELGLKRLQDLFELQPIEYPTTRKLGATAKERAKDLIDAFENPEIKAVIATIGGNDQITYIKNLPKEPFTNNPKPFFGFSDNSHLCNFLWLNGIPSFYGGSIMTQFAMQNKMDDYTVTHLKKALFRRGELLLKPSKTYNEIGLDWADDSNLTKQRIHETNDGFYWNGSMNGEGILWGGCLESIDEMLRHNITIPSLSDLEKVILMTETSEEIPSAEYVFRVYRALGERGILERVKGILVGRPKAWEFNKPFAKEKRTEYRNDQMEKIVETVRSYNKEVSIVQNINFGHTDPQVPIPLGNKCSIDVGLKEIRITM